MLGACREVPAWAAGLFAGAVVVLVDTSLLSESRGTILASGVCILVALAVVPGRAAHTARVLPPGIAIAATAPWVLRLTDDATDDPIALSGPRLGRGPVILARRRRRGRRGRRAARSRSTVGSSPRRSARADRVAARCDGRRS